MKEAREPAEVALSQRHFSGKLTTIENITMLPPGWQDGRWCGGIIRVCLCLCETDSSFFSPHSVFVCINVFFSISSSFCPLLSSPSSSLCLSVLCGVSTLVITLLTDVGLWAMQHLSVLASVFVLSDVHSRSKTLPPITAFAHKPLFLEYSAMRGRRLGTFHLFHIIRSI